MEHRPRHLFGAAFTLAASVLFCGPTACLDRPVVPIKPSSGGITITKIRVTRVDKVDLLFVVDNSLSMADKQGELGKRMPELISKLTDDTPDPKTGKPANAADIHVGVITSSLGSHGSSACAPSLTNKANDDRGHLLPRAGEGGGTGWVVSTPTAAPTSSPCPGPVEASALTWVFDPARDPAAKFKGKDGGLTLQTATSCVVQSADQVGCGYEETWEAMYHFLIDPAPYAKAEVKCTFGVSGDACGNNDIVVEGKDEDLLAQRAAFLRPDSLVAVIILSDENDFSLRPAGKNWLPWAYGAGAMQRGWEACDGVPDDLEPDSSGELTAKGCFSCFQDNKNANCTKAWAKDKLNNDPDGRNMRGFHQVQRFGFNFLWSRDRYVNGFKNATVPGSDGKLATNPLFSGGFRDSSLILVAGIVGVPKVLVQDGDGATAKPKTLTSADWEKIISPDLAKRDAHMVESIAPRTGVPRFAGDRTIDPVNGGDRDVPDGDDLQYACISPRVAGASGASDCESLGTDAAKKNPLCDSSTKQSYYKAYPGLRHLRMIERLGASGFVASICNETFSPAVQGIVDKLRAALNNQCIRQILPQDEATGNVGCNIVEVFKEGTFAGKSCETLTGAGAGTGYCTPGSTPCRKDGDANFPPVDKAAAALQLNLKITVVGTDGTGKVEDVQAKVDADGNIIAEGSDGRKHLVCEHRQLAGGRVDAAVTKSCLEDPAFKLTSGGGFCYSTVPAVVGECTKQGAASTIRFLGDSEPKNGSEVFTVCVK
ncbi:MAG: hypothetical protein IPJ34_02570 [Myxococcales bacterium]|nr:hypothetical protein [Myxococcales bacterium]